MAIQSLSTVGVDLP